MYALRSTIVLGMLSLSLAFGQDNSRVFHLTNVPEVAALREIGTILRTVTGIQQISVVESKSDIAMTGTDDQLALAEWIVKHLDSQDRTAARYPIAEGDQVVRILYLKNTPTQSGLNELVTALRATCDVQRIFTYTPARAIVLRSRADNAAMEDWLAQQLDLKPDDSHRSEAHEYAMPGGPDRVLKVVYLEHASNPAELNEMVTTLRTVADIQHVFARSQPPGIAFSSSTANVRTAEWVLQQLDVEPGSQDQPAAQLAVAGSDEVVRILYLKNSSMPAYLNEVVTAIRTTCDVKRIFTNSPAHAIVLRSNAETATMADWLSRQMDLTPDDPRRWEAHEYKAPGSEDRILKVVYLKHSRQLADLNEMVTTIRTVADIQRIFTRSSPPGIAFYSNTAHVRTAEWLLQQLDVEPDAPLRAASHSFAVPFAAYETARVFFLNRTDASAALNEVARAIRSEVDSPRMFVCTRAVAVAIRGTPETIAAAERAVKEHDAPSAP